MTLGTRRRVLAHLTTGVVGTLCAAGVLTGVAAAVRCEVPLWRIADLFFDFALLALLIARGPALLRG
jgi:hypothetical protein